MEDKKRKIVENLLKAGKLLTPAALDFLVASKNYEKLLEKIKEIDALVIDVSDFVSFETKEEKVKILLNIPPWPKEVTVENFARFFRDRYERLKRVITSRISADFKSISNLPEGESYCIGMAREIREIGGRVEIVFEDLTGSRVMIFDENPGLEVDDVVAIRCTRSGDVIYGKEIIFPDVPLREPKRGYGRICVLGDLHLKEAPIEPLRRFFEWLERSALKFVIIAGDVGDYEKLLGLVPGDKTIFVVPGEIDERVYPRPAPPIAHDSIVPLSDPSMVEINGVKILIIHKFSLDMLRKRSLGRSEKVYDRDYLVLEEVPDIVVCGHTHEANYFNFKSITIVNPGSLLTDFRPTIIDLDTREIRQLRF